MAKTGARNKPASTAITVGFKDILGFLNDRRKTLEAYAVRKYDQRAFLASAAISISENARLRDALKTQAGKASLFHALKLAANTGLSLNPQEGKAAIVPYRNRETGETTVSYQTMKNGLIDLVMETGLVKDIVADLVREKDHFEIHRTNENDTYDFVPARRARGTVDGYFAALTLKAGRTHLAYMDSEEIDAHEKRYNASAKLGEKSPWKHSRDGMAIKTVIKKLLRSVYLSADVASAVAVDDRAEYGEPGELDAIDVQNMAGEPPPPAEAPPEPPPRGSSAADVTDALEAEGEPDESPDEIEDTGKDERQHGDLI